jgi:hypothetical protein
MPQPLQATRGVSSLLDDRSDGRRRTGSGDAVRLPNPSWSQQPEARSAMSIGIRTDTGGLDFRILVMQKWAGRRASGLTVRTAVLPVARKTGHGEPVAPPGAERSGTP